MEQQIIAMWAQVGVGLLQCVLIAGGIWVMSRTGARRDRQLDIMAANQQEQAVALRSMGQALDRQGETLGQIGQALDRQGEALGQIGQALDRQGEALGKVGQALDRQGETLCKVGQALDRQSGALAELLRRGQ